MKLSSIKMKYLLPAFVWLGTSALLCAEEPAYESYEAFASTPEFALFTVNNLWLMISAALVFLMHLGFATLESGLTQSKNTVNVLFKNVFTICMGTLIYAFCGFNLMYPGFAEGSSGIISFAGFGIGFGDDAVANLTSEYADYTYWTDFFFQAMFAATAATIVSGAVAERIKLGAYMLFGTIFVATVYPVIGSWKWGGGWLDGLETPFWDFAGSTLVHSVGGWAALAGVIVLGPRLGKYLPGGKIKPIPAHSFPLATIGAILLVLGWFGFNGGSVLNADPAGVSLVLVNTAIAAAAGGLASIFTSWIVLKKPDLSMALNGLLAGLVGITASADLMGPMTSTIIGAIAGIIVVFSVIFLDKIKLDDPVGAISVHLVCGIWGTLVVGLFGANKGMDQLISQIIGIVACGVVAFISSLILWYLVKIVLGGIRVTEEEEIGGLDIGEHGQEAYADFAPRSR